MCMQTGDVSIKAVLVLFIVMLHENDLRSLYRVSKVQSSKLRVNDSMLCQ